MNFYSILTLVFVLGITLMKFDFGPMKKHEENAVNGDLFSGKQIKQEADTPNGKGKILDLVLPIVVLIVVSVIALLYVGDFFTADSEYYLDFIGAFGNTDATVGLPWAGLIALLFTIIYMALRKVVTFKESMDSIPKGFIAMVPAILILTFATALKNITNGDLSAAVFVKNMMSSFPETLAKFLPAVIFLVACVLAFATGTSWGTFGILIPIVIAMFPEETDPLRVVGISACLAGAVCGDHCSPISDTTILASAGAQCHHLDHVETQIPYVMVVAACSLVGYAVDGFTQNGWLGLAAGLVCLAAVMAVIVSRVPAVEVDAEPAPVRK